MGRLIDADELAKNLEEALKINPPKDRQKFLFQMGAVKVLEGIINEAEERFTDAVEVVRCKECKWRGEYFSCPIPYRTDDDFFCKEGKRKEVTE